MTRDGQNIRPFFFEELEIDFSRYDDPKRAMEVCQEYMVNFHNLDLYDQLKRMVVRHRDATALDAALEFYLTTMQRTSEVNQNIMLKVVPAGNSLKLIGIPANRRKGHVTPEDNSRFDDIVKAREERSRY